MSADAVPTAAERPAASTWTIVIVSGCGVASVALLAAALLFAHHWGTLADTIVTGWAAATLASAAGLRFLANHRERTDHSRIAVRIAGVAVIATVMVLVVAGVAWAAGGDPAGSCGGG